MSEQRKHISEDGQVRTCTAKSPATCTAKGPNGEKAEHYNTESEARTRSEELLSELHNGFKTMSKNKNIDKNKKIVVAIDLDNTVVDFSGGLRNYLAEKEGLTQEEALKKYPDPTNYDFHLGETPWFKSKEEFLKNFQQAEKEGLYLNLKAKTGAIKTIKKFLKDDRVELHVLTARDPKFNEDTAKNLKKKGLNLPIENAEDKENYNAHIFIDDKDSFAEKIRTGQYVTSDNIVKEVIIPENQYNLHLDPLKNWEQIDAKLDETVSRMFAMR